MRSEGFLKWDRQDSMKGCLLPNKGHLLGFRLRLLSVIPFLVSFISIEYVVDEVVDRQEGI